MKAQYLTPSKAAWSQYLQLTRPITLPPQAIGFLAASCCAMLNFQTFSALLVGKALIGALIAVFLNAASNSLNQIADLEIDRTNGLNRPLVTGTVSVKDAITLTTFCYTAALFMASWLGGETMSIITLASFNTVIYSFGLRTKQHWFWANFTIAITRGLLLFLAGWSVVSTILDPQPIFLGVVLTLFLLGAVSTKDFADVEGDRAGNCITLPVKFGYKKAVYIIWPFLCLPFLLLMAGSYALLHVNSLVLSCISIYLFVWGGLLGRFILKNPTAKSNNRHLSWAQMYLMFISTQIGIVLAYWLA